MTKNTVKLLAASSVLVGGLALGSNVFAQSEGTNSFPPFLERIAEHFNLDESEVTSFMEQMHEERHEQMQERMQTHLDDKVADGTITEEQKQLLLEKHNEMQAEREQLRQERQAEREEHRAEMEAWAEENGIDLESLRPEDGFGSHHGMRGPGGFHQMKGMMQ